MCYITRKQRGSLCFPTIQIHERNHLTHDLELAITIFALKG